MSAFSLFLRFAVRLRSRKLRRPRIATVLRILDVRAASVNQIDSVYQQYALDIARVCVIRSLHPMTLRRAMIRPFRSGRWDPKRGATRVVLAWTTNGIFDSITAHSLASDSLIRTGDKERGLTPALLVRFLLPGALLILIRSVRYEDLNCPPPLTFNRSARGFPSSRKEFI
jgi:hypothetical protein